jgi:hypothetical protein
LDNILVLTLQPSVLFIKYNFVILNFDGKQQSRIADIWYHKLEAEGVSDDQFQRDVQLLHDAMQTGEQSRIETALGVIHPSVRDIVETHVLALRRCSFGQAKTKGIY